MFRSIGLPELVVVLVFVLISVVTCVVPFWKIFSKAGYPGAVSIVMVIPVVNIGMLFFLAFSEWPILRELKAARSSAAGPGPS